MTYAGDPRVDAYIDDPGSLTAMINDIVANNRAGGWRKLKREADQLGRTRVCPPAFT